MNERPPWVPPDVALVNGVWHLGSVDPDLARGYQAVREMEHRLLGDAVVRDLPASGAHTAHPAEWRIRARSLRRLMSALREQGPALNILDVGCGNGWMSAALAHAGHTVVALDANLPELEQAARVFGGRDIRWCMGDPLTSPLPRSHFDAIVFAASLQYFADASALMQCCATMLTTKGVVHVVDTVLYASRAEANAARERSAHYYARTGVPGMAAHYHAHVLSELLATGTGTIRCAPTHFGSPGRWFGVNTPFHHVSIRPR